MYIHIPLWLWIVTLAANACVASLVVWSIARGARTSGIDRVQRGRLVWSVGALIGAWAAIALFLGWAGVFRYSAQYPFPYLALGIVVPLLVGVLLYNSWTSLREAVDAVPQSSLVAIQAFRVLGVMFLILLTQHLLPAVFALPAGIGDILTGLGAIRLVRLFATNPSSARKAGVAWNLFGMLDLAVAVSIGFLASTTPQRLIFSTPPTDLMTLLPLVMIPVFGIPLFLMFHALSLRRLAGGLAVRRLGRRAEAAR